MIDRFVGWRVVFYLLCCLCAGGVLHPTVARAHGDNGTGAGRRPWRSALPIWGDAARQQGHVLPLPFGIAANVMVMRQQYHVQRINLAIGKTRFSLPSSVAHDVEGRNNSFIMRFDAWVFPFLNVYLLSGYTEGETTTDVVIPLTRRRAIAFPFKLKYEGPTYGGGCTVAGGMRRWFVACDINYTETDLDIADSSISALVIAPRVGRRYGYGPVRGALWIGGMYQDIEQTIAGTARLPWFPQPVDFDVKQRAERPWNMTLGTQWELNHHWDLVVEAGCFGRRQLMATIGYRF